MIPADYREKLFQMHNHYSGAMRPPYNYKVVKKDEFTLKNICLNFLLITVLFFLNKLGVPGSALCYVILFAMAIRSGEGAIKAISLSSFIILANPYLISINMVHTYLRFPIIAVAGLRIFLEASNSRSGVIMRPHIIALLAFGLVSLMLAFVNQYFVMISVLKLGVFVYGACAMLLINDLSRQFSGSNLTVWYCALVLFFVAGNALAYVVGVGYTFHGKLYEVGEKTDVGYAGVTSHPQTLGSLAAISLVYAFCVFLFTPYRMRRIMGLAVPVLAALGYFSAARTGLFAAVLAIILVFLMATAMRTGPKKVRINISGVQIAVIGLVGISSVIAFEAITGGTLAQILSDFALKSIREGGGSFSFDSLFGSRIPLIEVSWRNFMQKPLTGIGFGTMLDPRWAATASIFSAPTEKGFLPTAVLEEVGIFGTLCFCVFLFTYFFHYWSVRNIVALGMMICFIFLNFGEMFFFALGGVGLYGWSLIGAGIALGDRVVEKQVPGKMPFHVMHSRRHETVYY